MLIVDDERARVEAAMDAHRAGQQQTSFECHWVTQSGERRLIDWTNTMVTDTEGDVQYILGTGIDITERRQLERQIIQVSEEERQRIGQDLHDILSSQLAGTAMMAKSLRQQLGQGRDVTADDLDVVVCQIQKASKQARALSHSLMPACIEGRSLDEALRQLAENKQELTGVPHTVAADSDLPRVDEAIAVHLYRIAYEAINNAVKHAEPSSIQIRLACTEEVLVVEVYDDGIGIPSELDPVEGLGLHMMHHRADVIGARLRIYPGEDGGTTVRCELPLDKTAAPSLNE
jgi:two-component system CheB/CheR fusion protein